MMTKTIRLAWLAAAAIATAVAAHAQAPRSPTPPADSPGVRVETVARGLEHPWAVAFLPDGRLLVTERPGRLRIVTLDGRVSPPLAGVPRVYGRGQGGLLDVRLDPDFEKNRLIYLSFAEQGRGGAATAVARGRLRESGIDDVRVIYRQRPKIPGAIPPCMNQSIYSLGCCTAGPGSTMR